MVALLLSTAQMPAAAMRATMVVLLLLVDLYALAWAGIVSVGVDGGSPLLSTDTLRTALWMTPAMLLGIWLGIRAFAVMSAEQFLRQVLNLLVLIASVRRAAGAVCPFAGLNRMLLALANTRFSAPSQLRCASPIST